MDAQLCTNTAFHATPSLYPEQGHAQNYSLGSCSDRLGHPTPAAAQQHPVQAGRQPCPEPALPGCTSPSASGWVQALHWEEVASSSPRDSVASEGLSLLAVPSQGCLLAFGGYNGRYHSTVQLFRPGAAPKAATGSIIASQTATDINLRHVPWLCCLLPFASYGGRYNSTVQLFRPVVASQSVQGAWGIASRPPLVVLANTQVAGAAAQRCELWGIVIMSVRG